MIHHIKIGLAAGLAALALTVSSCNDFLNRPPKTQLPNDPSFYSNESNLRLSVNGMLPIHFSGYNTSWSRSAFGNQTKHAFWSDDICQTEPSQMTKTAPASGGGWDFTRVKKMNILIEGLESSSLEGEPKEHWMGVFYFYRALENADLIQTFGSIPYYEEAPESIDTELLYKPQTGRVENMKKICKDLEYAAEHVRLTDGHPGLEVNRDVVCAKAADLMLFEGTWQKYVEKNNAEAKFFLEKAKMFARKVIDSGRYQISDTYRDLFTSEDLAGNPEILVYRSYIAGLTTHSVMSFEIEQPQINAVSKSLVESYRSTNGLAWAQDGNALNHGDKDFANEVKDRDPRLSYVIDTNMLHPQLVSKTFSTTGYFSRKYIKEEYIGTAQGQSSTNTIDCPALRYGEVLLIYAEASAELGSVGGPAMTQEEMDMTINTIRNRKDVRMPHLTVSGDNVSVNGQMINDPVRTEGVSPLIWEIRNERRVEMNLEGKRYNDLRRWGELWRADNLKNPKQDMGAWIDKDAILKILTDEAIESAKKNDKEVTQDDLAKLAKSVDTTIRIHGDARQGYIKGTEKKVRVVEDKHYLDPIPKDQIKLYKDHGVTLKQNPGWD